jgi:hypothetical protein
MPVIPATYVNLDTMSNTFNDLIEGTWTYRSLINDPDLSKSFDSLEFGRANLKLKSSPSGILSGEIGGPGWKLDIMGSIQAGTPATVWFQGSGTVGGAPWIYDYLCYIVPAIPNGINQVRALVGSVTRAIPHPDGNGGTSPAGVVGSFYAVLGRPA